MQESYAWYAVGFLGQAFFFSRFLVQWIASERVGRSIIPMSFWYLSLVGGIVLFIYAVHLHDPVFIVGQSTGAFVYLRNVYFRLREEPAAT
ncbi:MAG: lipid-A-disaccharide synthase N-terminal domain-containing protein [Woeseiaceae bacterium]|nr:lipid-A-disaccharide synthase N-terminal domain-containing protein [Woeseiaceae bacterium]